MNAIIDILLLIILTACTWSGYKKGIIMGIGGIVCIIVSIFGANLLAHTFSFDVTSALRPFAAGYIETQLDSDGGVRDRMGWDDHELSIDDLIVQYPERELDFYTTCYEAIGIDKSAASSMAVEAEEYHDINNTGTTDAVTNILCEKISYVGCFILAFLLIIIILTVIGNLPNLSYKLPNLDTANDIGGAALGFVKGILFCTIVVWVLKFFGLVIGGETLSDTILAKLFLGGNILSKVLGI